MIPPTEKTKLLIYRAGGGLTWTIEMRESTGKFPFIYLPWKFSQDGRTLYLREMLDLFRDGYYAGALSGVAKVDLLTGKVTVLLAGDRQPYLSISLSRDESRLAYTWIGEGAVHILDIGNGTDQQIPLPGYREAWLEEWSWNSRYLSILADKLAPTVIHDPDIYLFTVDQKNPIRMVSPAADGLKTLGWETGSDILWLSTQGEKQFYEFDPTSFTLSQVENKPYYLGTPTPRMPNFTVAEKLASPDGKWIAVGRVDTSSLFGIRDLRVLTASGQEAWYIDNDWESELRPTLWSQDSRYLYYVQFKNWDPGTFYNGSGLYRLDIQNGAISVVLAAEQYYAFAFSHDQSKLAYRLDGLNEVDTQTGKKAKYTIEAPYKFFGSIQFSPDSQRMAVSALDHNEKGANGAILIIDPQQEKPVKVIFEHTGYIQLYEWREEGLRIKVWNDTDAKWLWLDPSSGVTRQAVAP